MWFWYIHKLGSLLVLEFIQCEGLLYALRKDTGTPMEIFICNKCDYFKKTNLTHKREWQWNKCFSPLTSITFPWGQIMTSECLSSIVHFIWQNGDVLIGIYVLIFCMAKHHMWANMQCQPMLRHYWPEQNS